MIKLGKILILIVGLGILMGCSSEPAADGTADKGAANPTKAGEPDAK